MKERIAFGFGAMGGALATQGDHLNWFVYPIIGVGFFLIALTYDKVYELCWGEEP